MEKTKLDLIIDECLKRLDNSTEDDILRMQEIHKKHTSAGDESEIKFVTPQRDNLVI